MSEFNFEGGSRGGPSFKEHFMDREKGPLRVNANLSGAIRSMASDEHMLDHGQHGVVRVDGGGQDRAEVRRLISNGPLGESGTGLVGTAPMALLNTILEGGDVESRLCAEELHSYVKERWGGGFYRVTSPKLGDYDVVVSGPSKPDKDKPEQPEEEPESDEKLKIKVGATVWLELSRGGPYKVVGPYSHPLGASVPAHHPHNAPNTYETVRVIEGLWLCQDAKGVVHILAEGSLTTRPPGSRLSLLTQAVSWSWKRREIVLWVVLAGALARTAF